MQNSRKKAAQILALILKNSYGSYGVIRFEKSDLGPRHPAVRQGMNRLFKLHALECQVASFYFKPTRLFRLGKDRHGNRPSTRIPRQDLDHKKRVHVQNHLDIPVLDGGPVLEPHLVKKPVEGLNASAF